jgi:hypothetical protein
VSRHELAPLNDENVSCVTVGWEPALGSYFAHVYLTADDNEYDEPTITVGEDFNEVTDPTDVIDVVRPYARIPASLAEMLHDDAKTQGRCEAPMIVAILTTTAHDTSAWPCPF